MSETISIEKKRVEFSVQHREGPDSTFSVIPGELKDVPPAGFQEIRDLAGSLGVEPLPENSEYAAVALGYRRPDGTTESYSIFEIMGAFVKKMNEIQ